MASILVLIEKTFVHTVQVHYSTIGRRGHVMYLCILNARKVLPILYSDLLNENGQDFLDIQYPVIVNSI